jgi:hypothetical protein
MCTHVSTIPLNHLSCSRKLQVLERRNDASLKALMDMNALDEQVFRAFAPPQGGRKRLLERPRRGLLARLAIESGALDDGDGKGRLALS